jgi:hypothetical protein
MNSKEFDNIFNECLERLLLKGESLQQCLERYPEQAAELKPLLETALAAREATTIQPRPDFRARARYQFRSALKETAAGKSRLSWGWFPRWATVMAIVLVLVLAGGGTVFAAGSSMPDSPLYSVKLATEQVRLSLTPSQMGKAEYCAELADRRVAEIAYMANKGDVQQVEMLTRRLDDKLDLLVIFIEGGGGVNLPGMLGAPPPEEAASPPLTAAPTTTSPPTEGAPPPEEAGAPPVSPPAMDTVPPTTTVPQSDKGWGGQDDSARNGNRVQLRNTVVQDAASNRVVLREILDQAPESTRDALRRAIDVSEDGYEEALEALEQS